MNNHKDLPFGFGHQCSSTDLSGLVSAKTSTKKIKIGYNMYTATASLRAMEPPSDEDIMRILANKPSHVMF